jgi:hypothetical protein
MWTPRNIFGVAGLAAIVAFSFYFQHVRDKAQRYDDTVALLNSERETFRAWQAGQESKDNASREHQTELAQLRADLRNLPAPVIRVCPPISSAASATAPRIEATGPGPAAGTAAAGSIQPGAAVSEPAGADIGPYLQQLFKRSDELSAQLRAILHQGE